MRCPHCGERETRVVDSRDLDDAATIRRRRECAACTTRFTTYERVEAARLIVVKSDGTRQEFDRDKLASGLRKALTRRPVPDDAAEQAADRIEAELRSEGATEVPSTRIGALAMEALGELDQIAYIRFASVYQSFDDLEALKREVDTLFNQRRPVAVDLRGRWRRKGHRRRERPLRPGHPRRDRRGRGRDPALRPGRPPAELGRPPPRPELPRLPEQPLRLHRRPRAAAGPDRAPEGRGRRAVHPPSRRIRSRPDARMGRAAGRSRRPGSKGRAPWAVLGSLFTRPPAMSTPDGGAT